MAVRSVLVSLLGMLLVTIQCTQSTHVFMETQAPLSSRTDLIRNARALPEVTHEVIFVTQERNSDELNRIFHDVSNPDSPNYGKYWTSKQIAELTANLPARDAIFSYLTSTAGVEITKQTLHGEMITARASVAVWERMFHTEFYYYQRLNHDIDNSDEVSTDSNHHSSSSPQSSASAKHSPSVRMFIRAEAYSLPEQLYTHVFTVLHTIHMPLPVRKFHQPTSLINSHDHNTPPLQVVHQISGSSQIKDNTVQNTGTTGTADASTPDGISTPELGPVLVPAAAVVPLTGTITPAVLMSAYNVDTYTVQQSGVTNAIFASISQGFSPADLTSFQNQYGIPLNPISTVIGAHNTGSYPYVHSIRLLYVRFLIFLTQNHNIHSSYYYHYRYFY